MSRLRLSPFFVVWLLAGCPGSPPAPPTSTPAPVSNTAAVGSATAPAAPAPSLEADGSFVPLDEVDHMELPPELTAKLTAARGKIPAKLTSEQKNALDDLESRYQRIEAATLDESGGTGDDKGDDDKPAAGMRQGEAIAHALAGFYWDRLRLFDPTLDVEVPEELVQGFATSGRGSR